MELVAEEWEKGEKSEVTEDRTQGRRTMPMGHKAITKLQKLTIKPGWHTDAAIKPAGLPANRRIFLAFTTNHVATENVRKGGKDKETTQSSCSGVNDASVRFNPRLTPTDIVIFKRRAAMRTLLETKPAASTWLATIPVPHSLLVDPDTCPLTLVFRPPCVLLCTCPLNSFTLYSHKTKIQEK
ncbi:hypothetical protein V1477_014957 [Vespula maculifrons]|uniref:Uncharacterized protein n=1 Tax=Vespula maculifrons TaxID=7453 RepID=A0ABD2BIX1_VESMC